MRYASARGEGGGVKCLQGERCRHLSLSKQTTSTTNNKSGLLSEIRVRCTHSEDSLPKYHETPRHYRKENR